MVRRVIKGSGLSALGIGAIAVCRDIITRQHVGDAVFNYDTVSDPIVVTINGKAVFEDFKINCEERPMELVCNPGSYCTILSKLTVSEIYMRIKNFYDEVLNSDESKIANIPTEPTNNQLIDLIEQIISRGFLYYARVEKDKYGVKLEQYAKALKKKL